MSDETLYDLRCYVSNCFNARHIVYDMSDGAYSGYMHLSKLMIDEYDLTNNDVDEVVSDIEDLVSKFIMENSPKFQDND